MKTSFIIILCILMILASISSEAFALRPVAFGAKATEVRYKAAYQQMPRNIDIFRLGLIPDIMQVGKSQESRRQASMQVRHLAMRVLARITAYLAVSFIIAIPVKLNLVPWLAVLLGGFVILYDITMNLMPDIGQGYEDAKAREVGRRAYRTVLANRQIIVHELLSFLYQNPDMVYSQDELIKSSGKHGILAKMSPDDVTRIMEALCRNGCVVKFNEIGESETGPADAAKSSSAGKAEDIAKVLSAQGAIPDILSEVCSIGNTYTRNCIFGERIIGFDKAGLQRFLYGLIDYDAMESISLTEQEVLYLLGEVLSVVLSGQYKNDFIAELDIMLSKKSNVISPKSRILIESYMTIVKIDKPTIVTTVYAMFGEQIRMQSPLDRPGGEDAFRLKVQQKEALYRVNPLVDWRMVAVNDGNDRMRKNGLKSSDVMRFLLKKFYPQHALVTEKGVSRIHVMELPQNIKDLIGSVKGGAIIYGMRKALADGADYVIYTDQDGSVSLEEEGVLLRPVLSGEAAVSIGLCHDHPAAVVRPFSRRFKHSAFLMFARLNIRSIAGIKDTQVGFKAFSRQILSEILPLNEDLEFDAQFEYGGSFDVNLL